LGRYAELWMIEAKQFWAHVKRTASCWLWLKCKDSHGYGLTSAGGGKHIRAHRRSWMLAHGEIPRGMFVLHRCDNPACVNPKHLFLGTHGDNMRDMYAKGRALSQTRPERLCRGDRHWTRARPEKLFRGEAHQNAKVTFDVAFEIRGARADGATLKTIADRYGLGVSTVHRIATNQTWVM
jgi:hypothetical protein